MSVYIEAKVMRSITITLYDTHCLPIVKSSNDRYFELVWKLAASSEKNREQKSRKRVASNPHVHIYVCIHGRLCSVRESFRKSKL